MALSSLLARGWKLLLLLLLTVSSSYFPSCFCCPLCRTGTKLKGNAEEEKLGIWFPLFRSKRCRKFSAGSCPAVLPGRDMGPGWLASLKIHPVLTSPCKENQVITPLKLSAPFSIKRRTPCCIFSDEPTLHQIPLRVFPSYTGRVLKVHPCLDWS